MDKFKSKLNNNENNINSKFSTKKAAIQLSMSFLVMLIMAIVVFTLSLAFLGDFFDQSVKLKTNLDQQTKSQIENMLAGNERVAIPLETKTIKRGEATNFGVGVKNTLTKEYFTVEVGNLGKFIPIESQDVSKDLSCAFNGENMQCDILAYDGQNYETADVKKNIQYMVARNGNFKLPMNEDEVISIAMQTGSRAPRGHYIFNVFVCSGETGYPSTCDSDNLYGDSVNKIHIILK